MSFCMTQHKNDRHQPRYKCFILAYRGMHPSSWFDEHGFLACNNIQDRSSVQLLSHTSQETSNVWRIFLRLGSKSAEENFKRPNVCFSRNRLQFLIQQYNETICQRSMCSSYAIHLTAVNSQEAYWGSIVVNPRESLESFFYIQNLDNPHQNNVIMAKTNAVYFSDSRASVPKSSQSRIHMKKSKMFLIGSHKHKMQCKAANEANARDLVNVFTTSKHLIEKMGLEMVLASSASSSRQQQSSKMVLFLKTRLSLKQLEKILEEYNDWNRQSILQEFTFSFKLSDPWMSVAAVTQKVIFSETSTEDCMCPEKPFSYDFFVHVLWGGYTSISYFASDISQVLVQYELRCNHWQHACMQSNAHKTLCLSDHKNLDFFSTYNIFTREFYTPPNFLLFNAYQCKQCLWRLCHINSHADVFPALELNQSRLHISCMLKIFFKKKSGQRISFQTFLRKAEPFLKTLQTPTPCLCFIPRKLITEKDKNFTLMAKTFDS